MNPESRARHWTLWLALAVSVYGLNLLLSFHNLWPTPWITTRHQIAPEMLGLLAALALLAELGRAPGRRALNALTLVLMLLALGRYAEVTAPALYGRAINLYWDGPHIPGVVAMLIRAASGWQLLLGAVALAAVLSGSFLGIRWMLRRVLDGFRLAWPRRVFMGLGALTVLLFLAGRAGLELMPRDWLAQPVTQTYARQIRFIAQAASADAGLALEAPALPPSRLSQVAGADVLLIFMESYGVTTLDRPEYARALEGARRRLAEAIARSGREVVSARARSPTFGGGSWLAHLSLLSGVEVGDGARYKLLMTTDRETLVRRFAQAGYRVLGLMPGLRLAWPEGRFYGYDKVYDAPALDYQGPAFGWWRIPDQYSLARLDSLELRQEPRAPVFLVFPTITSHAPFRPVAPYQPDWSTILGAQPFGPEGAAAALGRKPEWTHLGSGYVESIAYAMTVLAGYLEQRAGRDLVIILLGDHQPPASVTGPGAPWDVPVHIIASRPALMQGLRQAGFVAGLEPPAELMGAMSELAPALLRVFD